MAALTRDADAERYAVRLYHPDDLDDVLALYRTVFGKSRSREWFEWRYDPPYVDGPQVVVAERAGTVVGAEPFITFRFETGEGTALALQPADAMVHPDHRRRGLLTRMTEFALEHYGERAPSFVFNFPNRQAVDAYLDLGWREVPDVTCAFRIQNPGRFLNVGRHPAVQRAFESGGKAVSSALHAGAWAASNALYDGTGDGETAVERRRDVPAATLAELYERDVPAALHARRDEEFFEWRPANPAWSTATYVARRGGDPVAAVVTVTEENNGCTFTKVMEALPMGGAGVERAMRRLLAAACRDHEGSDVVKMAHPTVPRSVSRPAGFLRGDGAPLAWLTTPSTMVVRPLDSDGDEWTVGGRTLTARSDWAITFSEQDTSY
jgi:GNAT superfamily N-acetyltransferase